MFPIPSTLMLKIGAVLAACALMYFLGWNHEHKRFVKYKADVAALGKAQEQLNVALIEKHTLITTSIKDEYEANLSAVHNYYADRVRNTSSSSMPTVSKPTVCSIAAPADAVPARQCAETTLMLTELQKWVKGVTDAK
jgi:hypothetical protein